MPPSSPHFPPPKRLGVPLRSAAVIGPIALGAFMVMRVGVAAGGPDEVGVARRPLVQPSAIQTLRGGETVPEFLARGGLSGPDVRRLLDRIRAYSDWTVPDPAMEARFHRWPGEPPGRIQLRIDRDRTLDFRLRGAVWEVGIDSVQIAVDTVVVTGVLETSLYAARLGGDADRLSVAEKGALAGQLARVYAWQIDFYRDPRPGDAFRVVIERARRPDGSIRRATVLAAEYSRGGDLLQAYRFSPSDRAVSFFYDEEGSALRGAFLRAPLDLVRVTSRFAPARHHPAVGIYRPHRGVDYGAASGTAVRATGDGTIERAGWAGDFGLLIEIDHGRGVRTRYAHLSGIAGDVRPGLAVSQGSVIGTVGSTGLSTAPHLHYEFLLNGHPVDPGSVDVPVGRPLLPIDSTRFDEARGVARALLGRASWPGGLSG